MDDVGLGQSQSEQPRRRGYGAVALSVLSGILAGAAGCLIVLALISGSVRERLRDVEESLDGVSSVVPENPNNDTAPVSRTELTIKGGDSGAIKQSIAKAMPAVVYITQHLEGSDQPVAGGSGFIIDGERGFVVTNAHVVERPPDLLVNTTLYVRLPQPEESEPSEPVLARRLATDPYHDLAVLKIDVGEKALPELQFGESEALEHGDWVIALGSPFGHEQTATVGIVSAKHRQMEFGTGPNQKVYDDLIQTDAAINKGNSGGPLINLNGEVIGINSVIESPVGFFVGIGFAIASDQASVYIDEMMADAWLGVVLGDYHPYFEEPGTPRPPEGHYCIVREVYPGGPAETAGVRVGDYIVSFDETDTAHSAEVIESIRALEPGAEVKMKVFRPLEDATLALDVTMGDRRDY